MKDEACLEDEREEGVGKSAIDVLDESGIGGTGAQRLVRRPKMRRKDAFRGRAQ